MPPSHRKGHQQVACLDVRVLEISKVGTRRESKDIDRSKDGEKTVTRRAGADGWLEKTEESKKNNGKERSSDQSMTQQRRISAPNGGKAGEKG